MQKLSVTIEKCPKNTGSGQSKARPAQEVTNKRLCWTDRLAIQCYEPESPGFHRQCLSAMAPEPKKINEQDNENVCLENNGRCDVMSECPKERVRKQHGQYEHCDQEERLVKHAGQPANKAW